MALNYLDTQRLVENWQCFGRDEELITEAALGPEGLGPGMIIKVKSSKWGLGGFEVKLVDYQQMRRTQEHIEGEVHINRPMPSDYGKALGAYEITRSRAPAGYGPLLYDVAMELATEAGSGIMADRKNVSVAARRVWNYYFENRPDVEAVQLDNMHNFLTPTDDDNARQLSSSFDMEHDGMPVNKQWTTSPLSKMYRVRNGTTPTLDKLRSMGKLDDWR